jgi:hypothetical protein
MRVCALHWKPAIDTLVSKKDGTEYDLCVTCRQMLESVLNGPYDEDNTGQKYIEGSVSKQLEPYLNPPQPEQKRGRGRIPSAAKKAE